MAATRIEKLLVGCRKAARDSEQLTYVKIGYDGDSDVLDLMYGISKFTKGWSDSGAFSITRQLPGEFRMIGIVFVAGINRLSMIAELYELAGWQVSRKTWVTNGSFYQVMKKTS